jgi:hypothetical protein
MNSLCYEQSALTRSINSPRGRRAVHTEQPVQHRELCGHDHRRNALCRYIIIYTALLHTALLYTVLLLLYTVLLLYAVLLHTVLLYTVLLLCTVLLYMVLLYTIHYALTA